MNGQGNGLKSGLNARLEELSSAAKVQDKRQWAQYGTETFA